MSNNKVLTRSEINDKDKWAINDIFSSEDEFLKECDELVAKSADMEKLAGTIKNSSADFLKVIKLSEEINKLSERVIMYSNMKFHEDTGVAKYQGYVGKTQTIAVMAENAMSFIDPEILSLDESIIYGYLEELDELKVYKTYIDRLYDSKAHTLSKEEESLVAKTMEIASAPSDIYDVFAYSDIKFNDVHDEEGNLAPLTSGRYVSYLMSTNREVRKEAFETLYLEIEKYINTISAMFLGNLKKAKVYADIRKYNNSLEHSLLEKRIPTKIYDNIVEAVNDNLDKMHKYVSIRKKALGLSELHMYDVYVPIVSESNKSIDFEEAKKMVEAGLAPMGEEYVSHLKEGFDNSWIDVYENKGKRSGAYSWGPYGTHPYVMLNYQGKFDDVFTLAHEMGHALHSYYSDKTQPYVYAEYQIFVAEVASTCNESLLIHNLLANCTDKKERAYLVNYFLECFKGTVFRQTMFAEFEKIVHEKMDSGEMLTVDDLCSIYYDLNLKYFGKDMIVDEQIKYEWARIPHFYTEFYVYQYATGFSAAIALSKRIMDNGQAGVDDYMKFLTGGSSMDPVDLLKAAGVDMSTKEPIEAALELFGQLVDEFEKLV